MLHSLLTSARGKSALAGQLPLITSPSPMIPPPPRPAALRAAPQPSGPARIAAPERCCVYCGHPLYAPPRTLKIRCPKCFQELPALHITLSGPMSETQILTAGKITLTADAHVRAQLVACSIDIAGMVLGDVIASHVCRIQSGGKVAGRVLCRRLNLEPGACLEGQVELIRS